VILQGTCTKLILNCRDGKTAEVMAEVIGKQERIDITRSDTRQGLIDGSVSKSEQIREVHTVMPGELQSLPPLEGYLTISDGTPAARVTIVAQGMGNRGRGLCRSTRKQCHLFHSSRRSSIGALSD
jgi:type IV secretory pathway TraG/TraD family ATPase VirD4